LTLHSYLNFTKLHFTTHHSTTLIDASLLFKLHQTTLHYTTPLHLLTLHSYLNFTKLHFTTHHSTTLDTSLHHYTTPLHLLTIHSYLNFTKLHFTTHHCATFIDTSLLFKLHQTTLHYTLIWLNSVQLSHINQQSDVDPLFSQSLNNIYNSTALTHTLTPFSQGCFSTFVSPTFSKSVFLNRRSAARYRALAPIIAGRERFYWNLSFYFSKQFSCINVL